MKKEYLIFALVFMILSVNFVSALKVENAPIENIVISELSNPAIFDVTIDNEGITQNLDIFVYYTGFTIKPDKINDASGSNTYRLEVYLPQKFVRLADSYKVDYVVNGDKSEAVKDIFKIEVIEAKDAIDISQINVEYGAKSAEFIITSKINQTIKGLNLAVESLFFEGELSIDLKPFEEKVVKFEINKEGVEKLAYGTYVAEFEINNTRSIMNTEINYVEKEDSKLQTENEGILVRKTTITRTNTGNVVLVGQLEASKDVFSRLFTVISETPNTAERNALSMNYAWNKELQPGESFSVTLTTNYTLPVILLLLIVLVTVFVRVYLRTNVILDKSVSYVKTKGGEFALKVRVRVKARKYVENVEIIDRLPGMTQLYEKFGIKPDKIDAASRRLFWNIERLNAGEERVYSYVIFSKVNVVGRFELPSASATYHRDGETEQVISNRAFFVAETGL